MVKEISKSVPGMKLDTYAELVKAVRLAMAEGRTRAEEAVERERVRTAWEIGKLIDGHILFHKERAEYDKQVLVRLAGDLGTSKTELYYMLEFARCYAIFPHAGKLSWSDYRDLLAVDIPEKRKALTEQAEKENWTRERLRAEVRNVTKGDKVAPAEALTSQPGKPGTYRVILAKAGPFAGKFALDLGFSNYYRPAGEFPFKGGDIVAGNGKGTGTGFSKSNQSSDALYTYNAYVYTVQDGDTLTAVVDLGFGFVTSQTLRLRGIDAPEIATADGMEAKKGLEKMLKISDGGGWMADGKTKPVIASREDGEAIPFSKKIATGKKRPRNDESCILIKTVKSDKYDRYLADVFVNDVYVNQKLVDEGLAVRVQS